MFLKQIHKMTGYFKAPLLCIIFIASFLVSCEDSGVINCVKKWALSNSQNLTVNFDNNGHLFVGSSAISQAVPPTSFQYLDTINGDFEIVLNYEGLFFNSPGLGFQVTMTANAVGQGNAYMSAMVGTTLVPGLQDGILHIGAAIDSLGNVPSMNNGSYLQAASTTGEFRLRRFGSTVEVISSTGTSGNLVTYSRAFFTSAMALRITYGSNFPNTPQYNSSIRFTSFRYYQGSTLVDSDGFDCNSIQ